MKQVHKKEDVPQGHHYSVLVYKTSSTYIEGDERSKTNPGHGYSGRYETRETFEHWVSTDRSDWERHITALTLARENNFVFFEVANLGSLETKVVIKQKG